VSKLSKTEHFDRLLDEPSQFPTNLRVERSGSRQSLVDYWVEEAVKAFEGYRSTLEMLDAFRYELTRNA
jgi:hypothetical protein